MDEIRTISEIHPRLKKNSTVRVPLDPLECWNLSRKENSRQYSSVAKVRNRLFSNEITPPLGDDKTIMKIQKKLDALSSIQTGFKQLVKSPTDCSPARQLSARRSRKGVTYRPSEKQKSNTIEISANSICSTCKTHWLGTTNKSTCDLCKTPKVKFGFEIELRLLEDGKASLIIGNKETAISLNSKSKSIIAVFLDEDKENTSELNFTQEWNEATRVATPSFHLNTDADVSFTTNISFPTDVSFSEHSQLVNDLMAELDMILQRQGKVLESPSMNKIQEVCQAVALEYGKIVKKVAVGAEFGLVVEKAFKGFTQFFDSCVLSLIRYVGQLQSVIQAGKESEVKHKNKVPVLNKQIYRYS